MDIPRQPSISTEQANTARPQAHSPASLTISEPSAATELVRFPSSDLSQLPIKFVDTAKLVNKDANALIAQVEAAVEGKTILTAKHSELAKAHQAITDKLGPDQKAQTSSTNMPPSDASLPTPQRTWLLKIGQQYVHIQSDIALRLGDQLALKLSPQNTFTVTRPSEASKTDFSAEQISALIRQALARTLPQQLSLQTGLATLASINAEQAKGGSSDQAQIASTQARLIGEYLRSQTANIQSLFADTTTQNGEKTIPRLSDSASASLIRDWMKASGIQFETLLQAKTPELQNTTLSNLFKHAQDATKTNLPASQIAQLTPAKVDEAQNGPLPKSVPQVLNTLLSATKSGLPLSAPEGVIWTNAATNLLQSVSHFDAAQNLNSTMQTEYPKAHALFSTSKSFTNTLNTQLNEYAASIKQLESLLTAANKSAEASLPPLASNKIANTLEQLQAHKQNTQALTLSLLSKLAASNTNAAYQQTQVAANTFLDINTLVLKASLAVLSPTQTDMKEALITSISALSQHRTHSLNTHTELDTQTKLKGLGEESLFQKPFEFPHPSSSTAQDIAKVKSILADQELSTGQILRLLAGMLNRIHFNQANSLYLTQTSQEPTLVQTWNMELPYINEQHVSSIQIKLEQHEPKDEQHQASETKHKSAWHISLKFELETIGTLYVKAELNPPKVKTTIWASTSSAANLVRTEKAFFEQRLESIGLEVEEFGCQLGTPESNSTHIKRGLVDTRA